MNRKILNQKEIKKIFKSIQNKKILKEKGGYLFSSSINDSDFYIGIIPVLIESERSHHYDIKLEYEDPYKLAGFFNVDGTIGMLFIPPAMKESVSDDFKNRIKKNYINTTKILVENGFSKETKIDWITEQMLMEMGNFDPVPICLDDFI